jgi:hypothetical protein
MDWQFKVAPNMKLSLIIKIQQPLDNLKQQSFYWRLMLQKMLSNLAQK